MGNYIHFIIYFYHRYIVPYRENMNRWTSLMKGSPKLHVLWNTHQNSYEISTKIPSVREISELCFPGKSETTDLDCY